MKHNLVLKVKSIIFIVLGLIQSVYDRTVGNLGSHFRFRLPHSNLCRFATLLITVSSFCLDYRAHTSTLLLKSGSLDSHSVFFFMLEN